jgi:hypothetical protein
MKAIELNFPFEKIDEIAEVESYRKEINRPIFLVPTRQSGNAVVTRQRRGLHGTLARGNEK